MKIDASTHQRHNKNSGDDRGDKQFKKISLTIAIGRGGALNSVCIHRVITLC